MSVKTKMIGTVIVLAGIGVLAYGYGPHEPGGQIHKQPSRDNRDVEINVEWGPNTSGALATWTINGANAGHTSRTTSPIREIVHTQRGKIVGLSASTVGQGRPVCTIILPNGEIKKDNEDRSNRTHCDVTAYVTP